MLGIRLILPILLISCFSLASAAELSFSVQLDKCEYVQYEDVWVRLLAQNLTDHVLSASAPLLATPWVRLEIRNSLGQAVLGTEACELHARSDADTITAHGEIWDASRLNFRSQFTDSTSSWPYFPAGEYTAVFKWFYALSSAPEERKNFLVDSVKFRVIEPVGEDVSAMHCFKRALANVTCRDGSQALFDCYTRHPRSSYADDCLRILSVRLGDPNCRFPTADRVLIARRLVLDAPDHFKAPGLVSLVHKIVKRDKSAGAARIALQEILDSIPPVSLAADRVANLLADGKRE